MLVKIWAEGSVISVSVRWKLSRSYNGARARDPVPQRRPATLDKGSVENEEEEEEKEDEGEEEEEEEEEEEKEEEEEEEEDPQTVSLARV